MSYILKQSKTGEIAACLQKNKYELDYYGARQWERKEDAERERETFLEQIGCQEAHLWEPMNVSDDQLKLFNVKLKNNPSYKLYLGHDGALSVQKATM